MAMLRALLCLVASTSALRIATVPRTNRATVLRMSEMSAADTYAANREKFWVEFEIPKKGIAEYGTCQAKLAPLLESSECITLETVLPFGLSAEPQDGRVIVTKDGAGGERVGDVLRFFSAWKQGAGGPIAQPDMVDVDKMMNRMLENGMKVPRSQAEGFDKVVGALCTNDGSYSESIVMVFERPIS